MLVAGHGCCNVSCDISGWVNLVAKMSAQAFACVMA